MESLEMRSSSHDHEEASPASDAPHTLGALDQDIPLLSYFTLP